MSELEFVVYLTNPSIVALDDCLYDPEDSRSLPKRIPVTLVHGSNRAKRVVDMLRRIHGSAIFQVEPMPPEAYAPERNALRQQAYSAAVRAHGEGIARLARQAVVCAEQVSKSPANLPPLENCYEEETVDDRIEFAGTTSDIADYLHCSTETVRNRAKDRKSIGERRIFKVRDGLYRVVPA